ncbi:MAG: hypothetical protein UDK36_12085 [Bacteroidaceae bacterium]|nr:hypothetical protein [Bacteroidaceae bacterium]
MQIRGLGKIKTTSTGPPFHASELTSLGQQTHISQPASSTPLGSKLTTPREQAHK